MPFAPGEFLNLDCNELVKDGPPPFGSHSDIIHAELGWVATAAEPVKLNETSGGWFCLCGLLGLDGGAGLVDPGLAGQLGRDQVPSAEPVRAGRVGGIEDLLAVGPDGPGGAVMD